MTETNNPEVPRQKRKYTKRAKMLLRSNNDYVDHSYWPKVYSQSKRKHARIMAKYGVGQKQSKAHVYNEQERKQLEATGINKHVAIQPILDVPLTRIPVIDE